MKLLAVTALVATACGGGGMQGPSSPPSAGARPPAPAAEAAPAAPRDPVAVALETLREEILVADVAWLTAPELKGRGLYSQEAKRTADRIAADFEAAGLEVSRQEIPGTGGQVNVIGILRGTEEVVVVCAHYDHLGEEKGVTYWGADDNASGTAVLLSLARAVGKTHRGRTIVFLASGAEEAGLLGTGAYVARPALPLSKTRAMINFDMVGREFFELGGGRDNAIGAVGLEADGIEAPVTEAARAEGVALMAVTAKTLRFFGFDGRTDDWWFRQKGIPTVHFSTGMHADYHKPTDTASRLKPKQMLRVARVAARVLLRLGELRLR